jgi:hypothetical protein
MSAGIERLIWMAAHLPSSRGSDGSLLDMPVVVVRQIVSGRHGLSSARSPSFG